MNALYDFANGNRMASECWAQQRKAERVSHANNSSSFFISPGID
jgi:hypothetical protein